MLQPILRKLAPALVAGLALPAQSGTAPASTMSVRALESSYLDCERRALDGAIGLGEVRWCSEIYEELKARVFDDDWTRLRSWSELRLSPEGRI